jgi:RNA polymerase sigma-70 factor (ECF subfamily)
MPDSSTRAEVARLVADHHAALYRYAYRLSGSATDAEDLVQQAFVTAQAHLDQVRCGDRVRSWLYAVLRNAFLKSRRRNVPVPAADLELSLESIPEDLPEEPLVDSAELQEALNSLLDEFRVVVLMFYFEQRSYKEIAAELGLPIGTVMSRLSRAKAQLREKLFPADATNARVAERGRPARIRS